MKKLLLCLLLFASINLVAQPYLSLQATDIGAGLHVGYLKSGIEISAGYNVPFLKTVNPQIFDLSLGKQFLITNYVQDNLTLTLSPGIAYTTKKDFTEYNKCGEIITQSGFNPIFKTELGKDFNIGRLFINANYCTGFYFGLGMRVFFE